LSAQEEVRAAAEYVRERCPEEPTVGLILGSGLSGLARDLEEPVSIPFADVPNCPVATVPGHPGQLGLGLLAGRRVAVLIGRLHFCEGYSMAQVVFPTRLLGHLGCKTLVVTNAAGGLNPLFWPGDLMVITDHINFLGLAGHSPLAGAEAEAFGPRFVDLKDAYDPALVELAVGAGHKLDDRIGALPIGFHHPAANALGVHAAMLHEQLGGSELARLPKPRPTWVVTM
jgi:purine-nucleoside phosphorylase